MIIKKLNFLTGQYTDFIPPVDWNCKAYSNDMDEIVNCPHCGKELPYGETYTSHRYGGVFGYGVCETCYYQEYEEMKLVNKDE